MNLNREIKRIYSLLQGNFLVVTIGLAWYQLWGGFFDPYVGVSIRMLGGSDFAIGALKAVTALGAAIVRIPGGYICDIVGRRRIAVIGTLCSWSAMLIRALTATDWRILFITHTLWSLSNFWTLAEQIMLMDSLPREMRGLGFAINITILGLASLASPYFGGVVLDVYKVQGIRIVLLFIPIMYTVKCIFYWRFLKESFTPAPQQNTNLSFRNLCRWTTNTYVETFKTLKQMPKSLLGFCVVSIITTFGSSLVGAAGILFLPWSGASFFILYAIDMIQMTTTEWGFILTLTSAIRIAFSIPGGRLIDLYGKKWAILLIFATDMLTTLFFIRSQNHLQILTILSIGTFISAITTPAWRAVETDLTPIEMRGRTNALYGLLGGLSAFVGSLIGGYIYSIDRVLPFLLYIIFGLIGIAIAYVTILKQEK